QPRPALVFTLAFSFTAPPPPSPDTLSLHDALPISRAIEHGWNDVSVFGGSTPELAQAGLHDGLVALRPDAREPLALGLLGRVSQDRKSTRLNSSHRTISYAVFCLKKKTNMVTLAIR